MKKGIYDYEKDTYVGTKKATKRKLRSWVKTTLKAIIILIPILTLICLLRLIDNDMQNHIERVSEECARQGYGIRATHTRQGDRFYVCNR